MLSTNGEPMRVLLDCRMADWSGIGRYTRGLTRALVSRGDIDAIQVVAAGVEPPVPEATVIETAEHPFEPAGGMELGKIVRRVAPDLTHCLHFPTPVPARHPLVVTMHDLTPFVFPEVMAGTAHRLAYRTWNTRAARAADRVLANSECTRRDIARHFPVAAGKTRVVLHTAEGFADGPVYGVPVDLVGDDETYILSMGNTKPHKGLPSLLAAFEKVAASRPGLVLVLVGADTEGFAASHIDDADIRERVRFSGQIEDATLRGLYRDAAVFAFPSLYEGFGLPPLEAMTFGTPVVCSDAASLPEVVGDAALTYPAGDSAALTSALELVLDDEPTRRRLAAAGPPRAASFTWERTADGTVEAYEELL